MAKIVSKTLTRDKFVTNATIGVVLALVTAFAIFGWRWRPARPPDRAFGYAIVGPLRVSTDAYSVAARIAVQTSKSDAAWADVNRAALQKIIESRLAAVDPTQVRAPGGLLQLQRTLKDAANRDLKTDKVEQILLTDFVLQTDV